MLRERALDAARDLACSEGWAAVSISRVAQEVGVSRPVLYKEIGVKQALAEALLARETDTFFAGIVEQLALQPTDPVAGLTTGIEFALRSGADNTLVKSILAGEHGSDAALLRLLAADAKPVLARAVEALELAVRAQYGFSSWTDVELRSACDLIVRVTLSHLLQPLGPVDAAVAQLRTIIDMLFARELVGARP